MRKFKFKIWNTEDNSFYISDNPCPKEGPKSKSRLVVTEFTGLKDKNGEEIFEGDIIAINNEKSSIKLPVKFGRYSFGKFIGECGENSENTDLYGFYVENEFLYIQFINENVVVVGNIFSSK